MLTVQQKRFTEQLQWLLTNLRRKVFSRRAPMHPANPKMNITPPTTRKSQTGSKPPRSVMEEILDSTPWEETMPRDDKFIQL